MQARRIPVQVPPLPVRNAPAKQANARTPSVRPPPLPASRSMPAGAERRTAQRVPLDVGIGFRSDSNFFVGFTEDISEGGVFIATVMLLPMGSELEVTLALPNGHEVTASAVVRWLRDPRDDNPDCPAGMGVQFTHLSDETRAAIHEFISLRQPIFYDA